MQFVAINNDGMPWSFIPDTRMMRVNPGVANGVVFHAMNPTEADMVAQAIPSISPSRAAAYFHKTSSFLSHINYDIDLHSNINFNTGNHNDMFEIKDYYIRAHGNYHNNTSAFGIKNSFRISFAVTEALLEEACSLIVKFVDSLNCGSKE